MQRGVKVASQSSAGRAGMRRSGRLAITEVDVLPDETRPIPSERLDAFAVAAPEAIEHYDAARRLIASPGAAPPLSE